MQQKILYRDYINGKEGAVGLSWEKIINRDSIKELEKRVAALKGKSWQNSFLIEKDTLS